jgi:hypothetical protein
MAKSFSSLGQNPYSRSKDTIVSVYEKHGNLYGLKENGSSRHMGGIVGGVRSISTSNGHAIIIDNDGGKTMINLSTMERRTVG